MKKIALFIAAVLISMGSWAKQKPSYFSTHDPNPDSLFVDVSCTKEGGMFEIVSVINVEGKTDAELYEMTKIWIAKTWNVARYVTVADVPNREIVVNGMLTDKIGGKLSISFKNGKFRWKLSNMDLYLDSKYVSSKRTVESTPRYNQQNIERGSKWLMADLYPFIVNIKKNILNADDNW